MVQGRANPRANLRLPEQHCSHCEYEITGLDLPGRLIRCPECGGENRIGYVDFDAVHAELPSWWWLALNLGWPALPWSVLATIAWRGGDGPFMAGVMVLGGLVLFGAMARGTMIAFDCSRPGRRGGALAWTLLWAVVGSVGVIALAAGIIFSIWSLGMLIEHLRVKA